VVGLGFIACWSEQSEPEIAFPVKAVATADGRTRRAGKWGLLQQRIAELEADNKRLQELLNAANLSVWLERL